MALLALAEYLRDLFEGGGGLPRWRLRGEAGGEGLEHVAVVLIGVQGCELRWGIVPDSAIGVIQCG